MSTDDEKVSGLYHEADAPGPSKTLDDSILNASRKAVEQPAVKGPFSGAWPAAASVAAVIVIAILLVPVLRQEESLKQTEQAGAQKSSSAELADEAQFKPYSAFESTESDMAPSPAKPGMTMRQDTLAEKQAMPASSTPTTSTARAPGMSKSSISAGLEKQLEADVDDKRYSRMEAADSAPFAALTPEMWEVKIARLIEDGELAQARAELEKLEQHFPNHPVQQTLLEKLGP